MKKIDIRSLLIGILATTLVIVTSGQFSARGVGKGQAAGKPFGFSSEIGRYQPIGKNLASVEYILDTSTGETWMSGPKGTDPATWLRVMKPVGKTKD